MTVAVRVEDSIRERIRVIAKAEGKTFNEVVAEAIEEYERQMILKSFNNAYGKLRRNHDEWEEVEREREEMEATLQDGLQREGTE